MQALKIAVFCSSSNHIAEYYRQEAFKLGKWIAEQGHTLVYGGATGGLMTSVAEGVASKNGEIIGVIAKPIICMNRMSTLPTQLITVKNLSERKEVMKEQADIFVVLPGGIGTMDELFDVVASGCVGEHNKPLFIINEKGFFDCLLQQLTYMKEEKCIPEIESYKFTVVENTDKLIELIYK